MSKGDCASHGLVCAGAGRRSPALLGLKTLCFTQSSHTECTLKTLCFTQSSYTECTRKTLCFTKSSHTEDTVLHIGLRGAHKIYSNSLVHRRNKCQTSWKKQDKVGRGGGRKRERERASEIDREGCGVGVGIGAGCPCPPVCNDIVTPRLLLFL